LLGVPLLVEGRVIGVIHTGKFTRYEFTDDDTRLLQLVADRIALAIDNARLFEEERTARREAEAASRAKDEFLTTISHELRTPLTPIIGWIHMIRNGILPEKETIHGLSVIEKNSYALKRLINDLLDMSAILSGKMRMEELPVSLEQVLREAVETVRPLAAARNIEIALDFHDWQNEIVSGDRTRLVQVFWNLLHNAVKFSSPGGQVEVDVEAGELETTVRIQDAGQGITAEFLPFVFERFRQADGSKTRLYGGLGLGLALVKSFVEAHQGTVKAESPGIDHGSRFTVTLPRRQTGIEPPKLDSKSVSPQLEPKNVHLMIVEDDPDTLEMLRATLEAHGFRVISFESAAEALAAAPATQVDLIISDIGMPEMDGFHMIEKLRQVEGYQDVPAIALSGYASQKDAKAALAASFSAHVSKPVDPAELIIMVNGLLQKKARG
jgi:signal transduction histidine kinase/CheY-like chemotaxis protein